MPEFSCGSSLSPPLFFPPSPPPSSLLKAFPSPNSGKKCWFKLLPEGEIPAEGKIIPIGGEAYIAPANIDLMYIHRSNWTDEQVLHSFDLLPPQALFYSF